jgi:hypothetical protein
MATVIITHDIAWESVTVAQRDGKVFVNSTGAEQPPGTPYGRDFIATRADNQQDLVELIARALPSVMVDMSDGRVSITLEEPVSGEIEERLRDALYGECIRDEHTGDESLSVRPASV